jgi:hypothetical protein
MADARRALADDHPLGLLDLVSSLLHVVDPRRFNPFDREPRTGPSRDELLRSFIDVDRRETSGLLAGMAVLLSDDEERLRIHKVLDDRQPRLPAWLSGIDEVTVVGSVEMTHVLGDGDDVMIGVRFPSGAAMTAVVYIDHNMGTLVKDAFVVPEDLDTFVAFAKRTNKDPDTSWNPLNPADTKTRIIEAIRSHAMTVPPIESESWPMCRPLVEWMVSLLPDGGTGYVWREWSGRERKALKERFLASRFAISLDQKDHRDLVDNLIWFGADYGPGDPMRWSPVAVEMVLYDWIPRKIVAHVDYLTKAPDVLRAFVRFCHEERSIRADLTAETLEAIDRWEPEYQKIIRSPRPQGAAALLASVGAIDPATAWDDEVSDDEGADDHEDFADDWDESTVLDLLSRAVGGAEALDNLVDDPLPEEAFDWTGISEEIRPRVAEVLELCDRWCTDIFDSEYRTASRRLLADIARHGPDALRRGRADTAAAAVCWSIGQSNAAFHLSAGGMTQKSFFARCGVKPGGVAQRAVTLVNAAQLDLDWPGYQLGSPRYLVSERRRGIIEARDFLAGLPTRGSTWTACADCGAVPVRVYLEGVPLCDECTDRHIADATGLARLSELPEPFELTGPDHRHHRLAYRALRAATGITVSLEELGVEPGEGYQFEVLGTHEADMAELVAAVREQAEGEIGRLWLEPARHGPEWMVAGEEVSGRFVYSPDGGPHNVVVDGRTLSWEELGDALDGYEGWRFRLVVEDQVVDLRPDDYERVVDIPDHVIVPAPGSP